MVEMMPDDGSGEKRMHVFSIGDTNFEVDVATSRISLAAHANGMREINIRIEADDEVFMRLTEDDDAPWSWALYPPSFLLQGLLVAGTEAAPVQMLAVDADDCECSLYMMEYRDVADLCLVELSAQRLVMTGKVDFFGKSLPFAIDMPRAS
ncbi:hypothetical protein IGS59_11145 [Janthinobacterium sp. GW460P]|uniref:hypothetical protein n=1 Tax=unclassified Janthinobacterium TaxID=2610881 RepID=UPI000A32305F|nr:MULTISPECIES: hypothetical protein [unclassified Janthinobacterium]MCC7702799.1 hypothetical protein [Janthinobacterium sp. GW460P]MCC7708307.1 hypothetical protein [Janthinobacterium sp. GW460W]